MPPRPTLYLIDGHSLAYRQHFAFINNPLMNSAGEPTSALYGFSRSLMDLLEKDKPHYLAVTFDDGLSGREQLYTEYKGTRNQMPDDLTRQMPRIYDLVRAFNMPILTLPGYEADDIIGTIIAKTANEDIDVLVISGDMDILQLLSPRVKVRERVRRKDARGKMSTFDILYDEDAFRREYNLEPAQLVDYKALKGDTSDNIPGVKGIGDKTATELLQQFGTVENLYEHIDEVKGATQKKLIEGRDSAFLSKNLATIRQNVPIELELTKCVAHDFDRAQVEALYREFEFVKFIEQLDRIQPNSSAEQLSLFGSGDGGTVAEPAEALIETIIVRDEAALAALVEDLNSASGISFDVESTSVDKMSADLVGIALATSGERGYYIPVGHDAGEQLPMKTVMDALRAPLTDPNIPKYAHNASYDLVVMQRHGIDVTPITFDTMVAEWLRDPASQHLGLKGLVLARLRRRMTNIDALIGSGKKQITMNAVDVDLAAPYAAADSAFTYALVDGGEVDGNPVEGLRQELEKENLLPVLNEIEMPLVPVLASMERAGVLLDTDFLATMSVKLGGMMGGLEQEIFILGESGEFNINSPKQLNDILFGKLSLKAEGVKRTAHGFSTAAHVLDNMRGEHPIIDKILQYRELSKLKSTYVDSLPNLINPQTGRVHTDYNQAGSATGRMSSSNPNLQNIPIRTEVGREVRRAFITPPGHCLLAVDYSQVELRIMAHVSEDPTLIEAFREGQDIHATTASVVYGVPLDKVTKEQRIFAKRVNFGVLYGMGAFRLARDSDLTLAEAREFIDTYFSRLPNVEKWLDETKQKARTLGYVETLFGRKRRFPILLGDNGRGNFNAVQTAEREAINMPIQGTAADIMKKAMIQLYAELQRRKSGARMILQVHDELVLEVPERELHDTADLVVKTMEGVFQMQAPLEANAAYGTNWNEMQDID